jgi:hypothetical protein
MGRKPMKRQPYATRVAALPFALFLFLATPHSLEAQSVFEAAKEGDASAVRELLADEPDLVAQTDARGRTLLHVAAAYGHVEICAALADAGAEVNVEDEDGETPLHGRCWNALVLVLAAPR